MLRNLLFIGNLLMDLWAIYKWQTTNADIWVGLIVFCTIGVFMPFYRHSILRNIHKTAPLFIMMLFMVSCGENMPTSTTAQQTYAAQTQPSTYMGETSRMWDGYLRQALQDQRFSKEEKTLIARYMAPPASGASRDFMEDYMTGVVQVELFYHIMRIFEEGPDTWFPDANVFTPQVVADIYSLREGRFINPDVDIWEILGQPLADRSSTLSRQNKMAILYDTIADAAPRGRMRNMRAIMLCIVASDITDPDGMFYGEDICPQCEALNERLAFGRNLCLAGTGAAAGFIWVAASASTGGAGAVSGPAIWQATGIITGLQITYFESRMVRRCNHLYGTTGDEEEMGAFWNSGTGSSLWDPFYGYTPQTP